MSSSTTPHESPFSYRPPSHVDNEVVLDPFRSLFALLDADGRPLGEGNAPHEVLANVELQRRTCKYKDSRLGKPMNISGLKQMTCEWESLLRFLAWLRDEYIRAYGCREMTIVHTWRLALHVCLLPYYLHYRTERPVLDRQLPRLIASANKLMAGIFQTMEHMVVHRIAMGMDLDAPVTPESLVAFADAHGVYAGRDGVCSGPPHLIDEAVTLVIRGTGHASASSEGQAELIGDVARPFAFADAAIRLDLIKRVFHIESTLLLAELGRAARARGGALADRITADCAASQDGPLQMLLFSDHGATFGRALARALERLAAPDTPLEIAEPVRGAAPDLHAAVRGALAQFDRIEHATLVALGHTQRAIDRALGRLTRRGLSADDLRAGLGSRFADRATAWLEPA